MQAVILCGGQGTRIRDVAGDIPKPMIPIGGRPILWHIMKILSHYGLTDFVLCLGYQSWVIKRYFLEYHLAQADFSVRLGRPNQVDIYNNGRREDWHVTLAETGEDAMTGCRLKRIERYIHGNTFFLTYGDGLADVDVRQLLDFHRGHGKTATVTAVQAPGRFGEVKLRGSQVVQFMEKPLVTRGRISGGFFVFERGIFERLEDDPGLHLEYEPMAQLAAVGELMAYSHNGFWHAMDNLRDHKHLNELWAGGKAPWKVWGEAPRLRIAA